MEWTLFANLLGAIGLGAASGLNAWIPLLGLGLAERLGLVTLTEPFVRLGSTGVLLVLGALFVLDLIGDKIAVIDHVLHALGAVVAPISGAIVLAAQENLLSESYPWAAGALGVALGGGLHMARSALRPAVTAGTGGIGNPIVSTIEDVTSFAMTILAILVPVLAFVAAVALVVVVTRRLLRRRSRRSGSGVATGAGRPGGGPEPPRSVVP